MKKIKLFLDTYTRLTAVFSVLLFAVCLEFFLGSRYSFTLIAIFSIYISISLGIGMLKAIRQRRFGVDILAILAIVSTLAIGQYWATIVIVAMLVGGEALEEFASRRAKNELTKLLERAPKIAHVMEKNGSIKDIAVNKVSVGSLIQIKPGEIVPLDAIIVSGESMIDESNITGESLPVSVTKNSVVLSGSINIDSTLKVKSTKKSKDSQYSQIINLVKAASDSSSPIIRLADRYAVPFTIISLVIATLAWIFSDNPARFAEVLVVATPCPLLIAAPVALISGMSRAARHGIIIKSGAVLENLSRAKTFVFDKTGTLTYSRLKVSKIITVNKKIPEKEVLTLAASAEQQSLHILGKTLVDYAKSRKYRLKKITTVNEFNGSGLSSLIDKKTILVGNYDFMKKNKVKINKDFIENQTSIYVAKNNSLVGIIIFEDEVRSNAADTILSLKKQGIDKFLMLTGDNENTAKSVAQKVGIDNIYAKCLPEDKLSILKSQNMNPTVMVGDGVNDAPVLAASDVGIAMGAYGETAASESADVVIMKDDIYKVAQVTSISKRTMKIAIQSILIGISASIILMLIASTGKIPAILGAGLQELIDVLVIANALRAHRQFKNE